ncbi:MAG: c-type cytochrome [Alphaproteobacteria bacterium]|nr:c-type cytochrome [Alphaproteobacteria bacterium]
MRQLPSILFAAAAAVAGVSVAWAQTAPPAPAPAAAPRGDPDAPANMKNRKVLPANITHRELGQTMRAFALSLGVRCAYCHVGPPDGPLSAFDFASDANPHKNIARGMIRMADRINAELPKIADKDSRVSCYSCHRGATKPALVPPEPPHPADAPKAPAS